MKQTLLCCGCGYTRLLTFEGDPDPALGGKPREISFECEECVKNDGEYTKSSHWKPDAMQLRNQEALAARKHAAQGIKPPPARGHAPADEGGGEVIHLTKEHRDAKEGRRQKRARAEEDRRKRTERKRAAVEQGASDQSHTRKAAGGGRRTRGAR